MQVRSAVAIAAVASASLIGLGSTVYFGVKLAGNLSVDGRNWIECRSKDEDSSLRGCSAVIAAGKANPGNLRYAHNRRSVIYNKRKQYDLAIQDADQAILLDPKNSSGYYNRALNLRATGKYDRALSDYNRVLELNPQNGPAWFGRGQVYAHREDFSHAIADYSEALKRNPNDGYAYIFRGAARAATGDLADALSDCNRGLQLRPDDKNAYDCRAFTYLRMCKYSLALKDYDFALASGTKNAGWLYCRSLVKRNLNDRAGSQTDLASALSIDPAVAVRYKRYGLW